MMLFLSGCLGGGGSSSGTAAQSLAFLDSPQGLSEIAEAQQTLFIQEEEDSLENTGDTVIEDDDTVARIHNPEPATLLLWGSAAAAIGLSKRRRRS